MLRKFVGHITKNRVQLFVLMILALFGCESPKKEIIEVFTFEGQQVTGITVSNQGRIFANFPRWRKGVENAVVEVTENEKSVAYPNAKWNSWKIGNALNDSLFIAVQSVVKFDNQLFVLDTRNPLFGGVVNNPRIFVFNLISDQLERIYTKMKAKFRLTVVGVLVKRHQQQFCRFKNAIFKSYWYYILSDASFHQNSYVNDIRIDAKKKHAYFTDSGHAGLIVLDLESGNSKRVLDNHVSTLAEVDYLTFDGQKWENTVHSDGIALDVENDMLYYHALTGYNLYAVPTKTLIEGTNEEIEKSVKLIQKTPAPDGMIFDKQGNLFLADLENDKVMKLETSNNKMTTFIEGEKVIWADTFSIYDGYLYYTNARINEANGDKAKKLKYTINKVKIN